MQNHVLSVTHFINAADAVHIVVQLLPSPVGKEACATFNFSDIHRTGYRNNIAVKRIYQCYIHHCSLQTNTIKQSPS